MCMYISPSSFFLASDYTYKQDLLSETVGPLQEVYIVHSSQGLPKGCAFAHFQRAQDAAVACKKYHGTHIDGGSTSFPRSPAPTLCEPCLTGRYPQQRNLFEFKSFKNTTLYPIQRRSLHQDQSHWQKD